jgi:lysozyme
MTWLINLFRKLFGIEERPPIVSVPPPSGEKPVEIGSPRTKGVPIKVYPGPNTVMGIDVSHYQPRVRWDLVAARGYKFCFAKAGDGKSPNKTEMYDSHRLSAKESGLLFGSYFFMRFGKDPVAQAENFLKITGGVKVGELPLVLDIEWDKTNPKYSEGKTMDEAAASDALTILDALERETGITPIIYTSWPFFCGFEAPERFFRYPLWCPAYAVDAPKVPLPWRSWTFWQQADQPDFAREVTGDPHLDINAFNGSLEELKGMVRK